MTTYTLSGLGPFNGGVVTSGNTLFLTAGQTIINFDVFGLVEVTNNSLASNTIIEDGGELLETFGSFSEGTTVHSGGMVVDQGVVTSTTISSGGTQIVSSLPAHLAFAGNTAIAGGTQIVQHGFVRSTTVDSGGSDLVSSGGTSSNSIVLSGGFEYIYSSGTAVSATVSSGGFEVISSGGVASDTMVNSGGTEIIYSGGSENDTAFSLDGTIVAQGGTVTVSGDATVDSAAPSETNDDGNPNGTCGDWSYTSSGLGQIVASNSGYISIGGTLTLQPGTGTTPVLVISSGGGVEVGGNNGLTPDTLQIDPDGLVTGYGTIEVGNQVGTAFQNGSVINDGTIEVQNGTLVVDGDVTGSGVAQIDDNSMLEISGQFSGSVNFNGGYETTLKLDQPDPDDFTGTLENLAVGDSLDLPVDALPGGIAHTQINGSTLAITFSNGTVWDYQLDGDYTDDTFTVRETGNDGEGNATDVDLTLQASNPEIQTGVAHNATGNPYLNTLVWGWGAWNVGAGPITYWFGTQGDVMDAVLAHGETQVLDCDSTVDAWTVAEKQDFVNALQDYSSVCGLTFAPASSEATADIVWWPVPNLPALVGEGTLGESEVPAQVSGGQLWEYFNDTPWLSDPNQLSFGGDGNNTIIHELGHTLGLAHPQDGGAEPGAEPFPGVPDGDSSNIGLNGQNQSIYTVMSYVEGWNGEASDFPPPPDYGTQGALGAFDIAALQYLYGTNDSSTGHHTYILPSVNASSTGWSCIWDPGPDNTISNAGSTLDCTIDLRPAPLTGPNAGGYPSYDDGVDGGFTIADGTDVDNAIGGSGNDTFYVNDDPDTIIGGGGTDTVVFPGLLSDYTPTDPDNTVTVTQDGVTDTLVDITVLQFADQSILTSSIVCFLAGTRIATASGELEVERLRQGQLARAANGDLRPVKWIGRRQVNVACHPDPQLVQPIRIRAGAFADEMPRRDLLVSPEHAIFVDGALVPARLLLNGATVVRESTMQSHEYFHVELDSHDILLAEGLPAESYLDTGNRGMFENADEPLVLHPDFGRDGQRCREAKSCAPLATDPGMVEPIWRMLADRAAALFGALPELTTTTESELAILAGGRRCPPIKAEDGHYVFVVRGCRGDGALISRAAAPCETRPWIEDRRRLGVMVKKIVVQHGSSVTPIALDDPRLTDGWWAIERDCWSMWRWTDGHGALPLPDDVAVVEVFVGETGLYPLLACEAAELQHDAASGAPRQTTNAHPQTAAA